MVKSIILILVVVVILSLFYSSQHLKRQYKTEVIKGLKQSRDLESSILAEADMAHLPEPVQKYLHYVGVVGKEKVNNFKATIKGSLNDPQAGKWMDMEAQQYSFMDEISRLFYLKARMFGIPVFGLHSYTNGNAIMLVKVGGLVPVVDGKGKEMDQAETVTMLNDMCIMAPATLIDKRIQWESIDNLTAKANFTNNGITVSAILYFNEDGQLVNFTSNDRYYSETGETYQQVPWSTPIYQYQNINGYNLASHGEAVWNFPDKDFTYIKLEIRDLQYNVESFE